MTANLEAYHESLSEVPARRLEWFYLPGRLSTCGVLAASVGILASLVMTAVARPWAVESI